MIVLLLEAMVRFEMYGQRNQWFDRWLESLRRTRAFGSFLDVIY
jgi:hypothetical protein